MLLLNASSPNALVSLSVFCQYRVPLCIEELIQNMREERLPRWSKPINSLPLSLKSSTLLVSCGSFFSSPDFSDGAKMCIRACFVVFMLLYKVIFGLYCVDIPYDVCMSSINSLFMAFKAFSAIGSIVS